MAVWEYSSGLKGKQGEEGIEMGGRGGGKYEVGVGRYSALIRVLN